MSNLIGALATGGLCVGAYLVWDEQRRKAQPVQIPISQPVPQPKPSNPVIPIFGAVLDMISRDIFSKNTSTGRGTSQGGGQGGYSPQVPSSGGSVPSGLENALLGLIGSIEAPAGYDQVYGGSKLRTPRPLTQMSVGEVLNWQDQSVAAGSKSSAAGRYQIIRKTLRGLVSAGHVRHSDRFDRRTQDRLGVALLEKRGLDDYKKGKIDAVKFGNNLAKEWASMPVLSGHKTGASYYSGDGLNHALTTPKAVLATLTGGGYV